MKFFFARIINHVVVYVHKKFGALKKFCKGCRSKMLIFAIRARSRPKHAAKVEKKIN